VSRGQTPGPEIFLDRCVMRAVKTGVSCFGQRPRWRGYVYQQPYTRLSATLPSFLSFLSTVKAPAASLTRPITLSVVPLPMIPSC